MSTERVTPALPSTPEEITAAERAAWRSVWVSVAIILGAWVLVLALAGVIYPGQ